MSSYIFISLQHLHKLPEQIIRFVRTEGGFGMALYSEDREFFMAETFYGLIVEVQVRQFAAIGHRIPFYAKAMILGCDFDLPCFEIFHRMICAAMSEF